jgi:hypothetical protein
LKSGEEKGKKNTKIGKAEKLKNENDKRKRV